MKKKLLYIVNVDWFFVSHRLPIALAALEEGYEVHVACGVTDKAESLTEKGIVLHPLSLTRSGTSIFSEIPAFIDIFAVIRAVKPDVIHLVTIKPVIYGGIASRMLRVPRRVASISGLGYVFISKSLKVLVLKAFALFCYRLALRRCGSYVIFQNPDDRNLFIESNIIGLDQAVMIRGSGVDLTHYTVEPEQNQECVVAILPARLLIDKGVVEFVEAARLLKDRQVPVRMALVGDIDKGNPKSITHDECEAWVKEGVVENWGYSQDIPAAMAQANIVVLPSYREGLPKSLVEAAACGRAVVTTDVPGCRDAIVSGLTGILVPVQNSEALADGIEMLVRKPELRRQMGAAGRELAEEAFDIQAVIAMHLQLYREKRAGFGRLADSVNISSH